MEGNRVKQQEKQISVNALRECYPLLLNPYRIIFLSWLLGFRNEQKSMVNIFNNKLNYRWSEKLVSKNTANISNFEHKIVDYV